LFDGNGFFWMKLITNQIYDKERALYGTNNLHLRDCSFDGPADGESALKESNHIIAEGCFFNLRYPFWHVNDLQILDSEMTSLCRAALWYSENIEITDTKMHGIKALRECSDVRLRGCEINSPEFGWFGHDIHMENCSVQSEYFMLQSKNLDFRKVVLFGKYAFQYIKDSNFENCEFDTKDAFWHAQNVTVKNSVVKGEYLGWYSDHLTLENCKIIGTQPLCYCTNLRLINCEMIDTDLCFEKSAVDATIRAPVISIKNPRSGHIILPEAGEIIQDDPDSHCEIIFSHSITEGVRN
jgi:hypothetical protein